jgi:hypothetical protein
MEALRVEQADEEAFGALRRGWWLGSQEFRRQMLERMEDRWSEDHSGELRR